ncbi:MULTISPECIES: histone deacetylase [unclassified Saccharothrix]|uniref:histone deacetylase n=1 Tax=unclassified Saccharothrix TaxID=2593673 RepID=UPI00307F74E0
MTPVWYVSYGSNMHLDRFSRYLALCRDPTPPPSIRPVTIPGGVYFATESPIWGGGRAFYDPHLPRTTAGRAYLITEHQFADVVAQEMYRPPGQDLDLRPVLTTGRHTLGPGRYETLLHLGDHDGHPALTFTAPWRSEDVEHTAPSARYLRMLKEGLRAAHGWTVDRAAAYLAACTTFWTRHDIMGI